MTEGGEVTYPRPKPGMKTSRPSRIARASASFAPHLGLVAAIALGNHSALAQGAAKTPAAAPSATPASSSSGAASPPAPLPGAPGAPSTSPPNAPARARSDVTISEESRRHFRAGVLLLEDPKTPRYEEAYREFKDAYAGSPSYKILGNLGLCAMKLERDDEAIQAYERYLQEGGSDLDPADRAQIERDLDTLRAGVVHVVLSSDPPGALVNDVRIPVQGEPVTNAYGPLAAPTRVGIRQGHHRITARVAGRADVTWEFDTSGGDMGEHPFVFPAPAPVATEPAPHAVPMQYVRPVPTAVYIGAGLSGVMLIGATVTGLSALHQHDLYEEHNDGFHVSAAESDRSAGRTLNVVTDVFLGVGILSAGVTTYLYLTRPGHDEPVKTGIEPSRRAAAKAAPRVDVVPTWQSGRPGVSVTGAF